MGKRLRTNLRLLTLLVVALALHPTADGRGARRDGVLYIRVRSAGCTRTKLSITLSGTEQRPKSILLSVSNDKTNATEVEPANVGLQGDEYVWVGVIPLGNFTASVSYPEIGKPLTQKFTNIKLLLPFRDGARPYVQLRSGDGNAPDADAQLQERQQRIAVGSLSQTAAKIHLLLIGSDEKLAAQYLGPPVTVWTPVVPDGRYKLVVVEYDRDGSGCKVDGRNR